MICALSQKKSIWKDTLYLNSLEEILNFFAQCKNLEKKKKKKKKRRRKKKKKKRKKKNSFIIVTCSIQYTVIQKVQLNKEEPSPKGLKLYQSLGYSKYTHTVHFGDQI